MIRDVDDFSVVYFGTSRIMTAVVVTRHSATFSNQATIVVTSYYQSMLLRPQPTRLCYSNDAIKRWVQRETICLQTDESKVKGSVNGLLDWVTIRLLLVIMIEIGNSELISVYLYAYKQTSLEQVIFLRSSVQYNSVGCCLTTVQITTILL